ncbi:hypothetical protein BDP55DRAFT_627232 [Colletotrichum godetiae]|uniref:Uncharacterized protein n=1 Tax=Colletotrichum godetiae TaxID=1209918 RepID=A0AAJ0AWC3_9PEZI|nr:uncharacterized protein BDP55DRAFT_627232 [Colletotrichum godetiae]KAK1691593.1 hypothetical protein BDP55DRAFT_627232 [Colletotrichum godetiae]
MDGANGLAPALPELNKMRWAASSRPAPRERRWIRNDIKSCSDTGTHPDSAHMTDQEEGSCVLKDLSSTALSFSLSPTVNCIGGVLIHLLDKFRCPARSGPCLAVKRPGVPRDPFARMADVHFQGVRTARLVFRASRPKTPATVHFVDGTVHSGQGVSPCVRRLTLHRVKLADHNPTQPSCSYSTLSLKTVSHGPSRLDSAGSSHNTSGWTAGYSIVPSLPFLDSCRPDLRIFLSARGLARHWQCTTNGSAVGGTPGYVACRRDDGKTGAWIAMFWDGAKTDSRLTIPAARLRAASPEHASRTPVDF